MSKNKGFYKTLFYINITKSLYACLLLLIFKLFKVMRLTQYIILPLNLKYKVFIPLNRNLEDFEEALKYVYFGIMYEMLPEFKPKCNYTVVDVGSHYGFYTLKVASKVRKVLSLEPNPRCYYVLVHNLLINKLSNVKAISVAAGSKKTRAFIKSFTDGISQVTFKEEGAPTLIVPLDELLQMLGISSIDIMKIDVEGYEVEVLKGLMTYIKNDKVKRMVAEIHNEHLLREVVDILSPHFHHMRIFNVSDDVFIIYISL